MAPDDSRMAGGEDSSQVEVEAVGGVDDLNRFYRGASSFEEQRGDHPLPLPNELALHRHLAKYFGEYGDGGYLSEIHGAVPLTNPQMKEIRGLVAQPEALPEV